MTAAPLTGRQAELIRQASETLCLTAAAIAAGMRDVDTNSKEAVYWAAYSQTKVRLAGALAVIDEVAAAKTATAAAFDRIAALLAGLDWEHEDPRHVLKAIARIIGGEQ